MSSIKWQKSYDLFVDDKFFRIFISQDGEQFYSICLWYEGERLLKARGQKGGISFHLEKRFGNSEKEALNQILDWVKNKYGEEFELKESN